MRSLLLTILLVGGCDPTTTTDGDTGSGNPCTTLHVETVTVELDADDVELTFRAEQCRADRDACSPLCVLVYERTHLGGLLFGCTVEFPANRATVHLELSDPACHVIDAAPV